MFSENLTQKHYLANLTWYNVLSQEHDSFLQKTEDLEELKYSLAFMKLLLAEVSENRSPKESLKWLGRQVHQWSQYSWYEIPRAVAGKEMLFSIGCC